MVEKRSKRLRGCDCERVGDVFGEAHSQVNVEAEQGLSGSVLRRRSTARFGVTCRSDRTCLLCVTELQRPVGGRGLDQNYHLTYTSKDCCLSNGRGVGVKPVLT